MKRTDHEKRAEGPAESEIRRLFGRLRQEDEHAARTFQAHLAALRQRAGNVPRARLSFRLAAAALATLLLAGSTFAIWRHGRPSQPGAVASIVELSRWHAPTDSLLRTPGDPLLRTVPRFGIPPGGENPFGDEAR
jgi:hypothetical protein